ncbi:helix-turn-helix protein [Enterobacter sp. BIGb0383]|uniref:helix-turn-helix domain-containing protein n=1 Tax=unclassified Enterobacter TaxID=2608935 RepID=UPI000F491CA3|nr:MULTISPECIES: helix-turn-helix domain-containing protein [unclassified Enterobacter]ROP58357.1 helix-turn-helix protein [Enterobacter sp. BIGb0383]ROS06755.1 helix-turn-helix protein [Enterobacter sp. BIGb0359]
MTGRIDYQIENYRFTELNESPRLTRQWVEVSDECRQAGLGAEARLRLALLNVDYVSSFELPFRLLLVRTPQLIAGLRDELQISQKSATFNGKRFGCVYSLKTDLSTIPDEFRYSLATRIRRVDDTGTAATPFQQIAKETKSPKDRLKLALESGLAVTALDALFWFGSQRIAADIATLRKRGMRIATAETDVSDNLTGTTRRVPLYRLVAAS